MRMVDKAGTTVLCKFQNPETTGLKRIRPLAGCPVGCKDEMMSGAGGVDVKMNPRLQFFTHHFKGRQLGWNFEADADRR
jgi:hypothetical protein